MDKKIFAPEKTAAEEICVEIIEEANFLVSGNVIFVLNREGEVPKVEHPDEPNQKPQKIAATVEVAIEIEQILCDDSVAEETKIEMVTIENEIAEKIVCNDKAWRKLHPSSNIMKTTISLLEVLQQKCIKCTLTRLLCTRRTRK